ncbi:hypothetical protein CO046_00240 [Candidatus Peregrinibacteria bacterium CG_4_9_14_0_2_um_filter_53_11]|nr:MAG: hypothetical protein CO046_00240 [Candidatus Peregrinibacteria bacterium CG_4_9_14_0_2_um_filter_53_11]
MFKEQRLIFHSGPSEGQTEIRSGAPENSNAQQADKDLGEQASQNGAESIKSGIARMSLLPDPVPAEKDRDPSTLMSEVNASDEIMSPPGFEKEPVFNETGNQAAQRLTALRDHLAELIDAERLDDDYWAPMNRPRSDTNPFFTVGPIEYEENGIDYDITFSDTHSSGGPGLTIRQYKKGGGWTGYNRSNRHRYDR